MKAITKSEFKLGLGCLLKLRYAREGLPQAEAGTELLAHLAEGGAAIEALCRAAEPPSFEGAYLGEWRGAEAIERSFEAIRRAAREARTTGSRQTLYEPTIEADGFHARIDCLRIHADRFELVEIKAKTHVFEDGAIDLSSLRRARDSGIQREWLPYLQDIAFQAETLRRWLSAHAAELGLPAEPTIDPRLRLVDRDAEATEGETLSAFEVTIEGDRAGAARGRSPIRHVGPRPPRDGLTKEGSVEPLVELLRDNAEAGDPALGGLGLVRCMEEMRRIVVDGDWPTPAARRSVACLGCEFRVRGDPESGFARCWGPEIDRAPHSILRLTRLADRQLRAALDAATGRAALITDVPERLLGPSQRLQLKVIRDGRPSIDPDFAKDPDAALRKPADGEPLHFLDFECESYPIPARVGGYPYELVPFQFEAHRLPSFDARLEERVRLEGFLDLDEPDPRRDFIRALDAQLGEAGPVYHWHSYEPQVVRAIRATIADERESGDDRLLAAIDATLERLVDLKTIAQGAFLHPAMDGSYSIKKVLPIAWEIPEIRHAFGKDHAAEGDPERYEHDTDPYRGLPSLPEDLLRAMGGRPGGDDALSAGIRNGGMAMLAYHYGRMRGRGDDPAVRDQLRDRLRRYCRLDSAAMVMVFAYLRDVLPRLAESRRNSE